jgi:iron(III) transport system ATP-binding protein
LRVRLGSEIRDILKQQGITALLVTHDQGEAFAVADEIGVMRNGHLEQWDSAYNLYHRPASRFVAEFVGEGCFVPGQANDDGTVQIELGRLAPTEPLQVDGSREVDVLLRPDDIVHDDDSSLTAIVLRKAFRGAAILYTLGLPSGRRVLAMVHSHHDHRIGERIGIRLEADHVVVFPRRGDVVEAAG